VNRTQITNIEDAGRATMAWVPEGSDGRPRSRAVLGAILSAGGILAVAALLLLAVL
jgi:hypothetical protein